MPQPLSCVKKVRSKGRTDVPEIVREALGIAEGDRVVFCLNYDGKVSLRRAKD